MAVNSLSLLPPNELPRPPILRPALRIEQELVAILVDNSPDTTAKPSRSSGKARKGKGRS